MKLMIDRAGRVVIPKAVRSRLGLAPGDVLDVELDGARLVLTADAPPARIIEKDGRFIVAAQPGAPALSLPTVLDQIDESRDWPRS